MKDYFDLFILSRERRFNGGLLTRQIAATFSRRETPLPSGLPTGLTDEFAMQRQRDWAAFLKSSSAEGAPAEFTDVVREVRGFAYPPLSAASRGQPFAELWVPSDGWQE